MNLNPAEQAMAFGVLLSVVWTGFLLAFLVRRFRPFSGFAARLRRASIPFRFLVVVSVVAFAVYGGSKGDGGSPQNSPRVLLRTPSANVPDEETPSPEIGLVSVLTNGVSFVPASSNSVEAASWRRVGGTEMGTWIEAESGLPLFTVGTNPVFRAYATASGSISFESMRRPPVGTILPDGTGLPVLCPLRAFLGFVPESCMDGDALPQRFWHEAVTGIGTVLTWENALLDRISGRHVSFQAELRPSGDFVFRYAFPDALDPPPAKFLMGAQTGTNGVNALSVFGTNVLSSTVWRVDGTFVSNGVSVAELLCTNGILKTPAAFALEWRNLTGIAGAQADSDEDGLSDWDEAFLHGTDFNLADTDGDGIGDGAEILGGTNPLDADENEDGVPDGADPLSYFSNPLFAEPGCGNVVVALESGIPAGSSATLIVGGLSLPLRDSCATELSLPDGTEIDFRLFASGPDPVPLSISPGPDWTGDGFWLEDASGVFHVADLPTRSGMRNAGTRGTGGSSGSGGSHGGTGRMGRVRISLAATDPSEWDYECLGDYCVTSGGTLHLALKKNGEPLSPGTANITLSGLSGDGTAPVLEAPGIGTATISGVFLRWGEISASVSAHLCDAPDNNGTCSTCGHSPGVVGPAITNMALTLKHDADASLDVPVSGRGQDDSPIVSRRVQIRRQSESRWYRLRDGAFPSDWTAKVAGHFVLRAVATDSNGHEYFGEETPLEVMFPNFDEIASNSFVVATTDAAWAATLTECSQTNRRERGFWIFLNTETGSYDVGDTEFGPWVDNSQGAYVNLSSRPIDNPMFPAPYATGCRYPVASFHCHTPTTYRSIGRTVGPSLNDNQADLDDNVPGVVYDYVESCPGSGSIPEFHPLNSAAKRYKSLGLERRPTPD